LFHIIIRVGFITLQIETANQNFFQRLQSRFQRFIENEVKPDGKIILSLTQELIKNIWVEPDVICKGYEWTITGSGLNGRIDQKESIAEFEISPSRTMQEVEYLIRIASAIWIFEKGGLLIHGAALVRKDRGYLFTGHSGAGKTTVCRVSKNALILNDDLITLGLTKSGWEVLATPFSNPTQNEPNPGKAPLKTILHLNQAKEHRIDQVTTVIALADLITHIPVLTVRKENMEPIMNRCHHILKEVKTYNLYFLPDDRFWDLVPEFP
jgi:hypothetical protein